MTRVTLGLHSLRVYLEMIKVEHSVFALPFAMVGMVWASASAGGSGWPGWRVFALILVAMVMARSAAMAFNRIADRSIDARNPRTAKRALPAGTLTLRQAMGYFLGSVAIFLWAAWSLNPLALALSPVALTATLGYSLTKRYTAWCHAVLGLSLGIAPAGAWVAVTGQFDLAVVPLVLAVASWTAGFDILYSLQDEDFDRAEGLHSAPQKLGGRKAILVSRLCHVACVGFLAYAVTLHASGWFGWAAWALAAILLAWEQSLVRHDDLSRLNTAFFTLNGMVSIGVFVLLLAEHLV